ncbi:MAG: hypothetical protein IH989_02370 [Planctomycetes bacterium]|nr:hypothetical protein [Planctomycetota bacterium]
MAYDEFHDQVVLFGGGNCCTGFDDTWLWDPTTRTWSEVQGLNPNPLERSRHAMAYDSRRQVVVMFGGEPCSSCGSGSNPGPETWEWDGSSWRLKHDSAPSRRQHAMVYDPVDDVVLLYGGWPTDRETWVYSVDEGGQATWTRLFPVYPLGVESPPGLIGHRMVYDTQRQAVVMFGGKRVTGGEGRSADTWAWDRARQLWLKLDTTNDPPARTDPSMSYDRKRHASVIFGGSGDDADRDTWELTSGFPSSEVLSSDQVIVDFGQRLELSIIADGLGPFTYHWFKDGRPIAELGCSGVAGVQTDTLVIEPVNAGDSGSYSVAVSNRCNIDTPLMTSSILVTVDAAIQDCNRNGRDDATDLICGGEYVCSGIAGSFDCDNNGIPDECRAADFDLEQFEDFESIGMGSFTLNGSATVDGGSVRLTEAVNSLLGTVIFEPMSTERMSAFTASFDFQMGQGTSPGADGISFALLDTTLYGPTVLFGEEGPGPASLVLQFDTHDNSELDLSGNFVQISHNGVPVASVEPPFMLDDFRWYHAEIVFAESNLTLTLTPSGAAPVVIFDTVSVFGFVPFVATYGFGGRTGGLNNEQRIDNVYFSTRTSGFACDSADVSPCEGDAGDINADGVVNINDHAGFVACMNGAGASPTPEKPLTVGRCLAIFDFENDGDVDLLDVAEFQLLFAAP